jgi:hypothetical protein
MKEGDAIKIVNEILGYKVPAFVPRFRREQLISKSPPISIPTKSSDSFLKPKSRIPIRNEGYSRSIRSRNLSDPSYDSHHFQCDEDEVFEFEMEEKNHSESAYSPTIASEKEIVWQRYGMSPRNDFPSHPLKNKFEMKACSALIERAYREGLSDDNISVILINFGN